MNIQTNKIIDNDLFNKIKSPEVQTIGNKKVVIRFFEYLEKKCGIKSLNLPQSKFILNVFKEITGKEISNQYTFKIKYINFQKDDEYSKCFGKYSHSESFVEIIGSKENRIFGFFIGGSDVYPPSFNVVLITSDKHFEY